MGPFVSIISNNLQYMGISYFSVVSHREPSDIMLLFLWCAPNRCSFIHISFIYLAKINEVLFRAPFLLLTRPFYHIGLSHFLAQFHLEHLLTKCFYSCAVQKSMQFHAPFRLLTRPFYNIWVSHISVQFHFGHLLTKCYYSCGAQKSMQFHSGHLSFY